MPFTHADESPRRRAQSLIEYALILALVVIVVVTALMALGRKPERGSETQQQTQEREMSP